MTQTGPGPSPYVGRNWLGLIASHFLCFVFLRLPPNPNFFRVFSVFVGTPASFMPLLRLFEASVFCVRIAF